MNSLDQIRRTLAYSDGTQTLSVERTYPTTIDDLWDACTDAERIPRWFLPVRGELREGGSYAFEGHAHGTIESCDPPNRFRATWEFGGEVSWIEVSVAPADDGATLRLVHTASTENDHWEQYGPGAVGVGWDGLLHGLGLHLASGEPLDPEVAAEWPTSAEGQAFTRGSGDQWRHADVAAGTPTADAERRAAGTVAAFLGE